MFNSTATVSKEISGDGGLVRYQGEIWRARTDDKSRIKVNNSVQILKVENGILIVKASGKESKADEDKKIYT